MKHRLIRYLGLSLISGALGISAADAADHSTHAQLKQAGTSDAEKRAIPALILSEPDFNILKDGYVYLPFRVENIKIFPMYSEVNGEEVTKLIPRIGHLHVGVDDAEWVWIHASTDPIYFGKLSPGVHSIRFELVDAAHRLLEKQTLKVIVP